MGQPSTHALICTGGKGRPRKILFTRPGDALWDHVIGEYLTLTPDGERVAYVRDAQGTQFPGAYLMEGLIEILDIRTGKTTQPRIRALDQGICWFPDDRRLAYVQAIPAASTPALAAGEDGFGSTFAGWDRIPVVHVLDTQTGQTRKVHVGWTPRASTDGRQLMVEDMVSDGGTQWVSRRRLVDLQSGASKPVTLPGAVGSVLALKPDGTVLYWALPTAGTPLRSTRNNSPLVGAKPMLTLKVGVLNTGRFQTVVPYIDPRTRATWGR